MADTENRKKWNKKYYHAHKEVINKRNREYRLTHKEAINKHNREYMKRYYRENKEAILKHDKERKQKIKIEKPWRLVFQEAKKRCTNSNNISYKYYGGKGIKFKLTMDEVKTLYLRDGAKDMKRPSIDRIYNDGNYAFGNCRFIELSENIARSNRNRNLRKAL